MKEMIKYKAFDKAASEGDIVKLDTLILGISQKGVDKLLRGANFVCNPLNLAAAHGHLDMVEKLLSLWDPRYNNDHSNLCVPFNEAVENGHTIIMERIWHASSKQEREMMYDPNNPRSWRRACEYGKVDAAVKVLKLAPSHEVKQQILSDKVAISWALRKGHRDIAKIIIAWSTKPTLNSIVSYVASNKCFVSQARKDWFLAYDQPGSELGELVARYKDEASSTFDMVFKSAAALLLPLSLIYIIKSYISPQSILLSTSATPSVSLAASVFNTAFTEATSPLFIPLIADMIRSYLSPNDMLLSSPVPLRQSTWQHIITSEAVISNARDPLGNTGAKWGLSI